MLFEILPYDPKQIDLLLALFYKNCPTYFAEEELQDFTHYLQEETEDYYVIKVYETIVGCGGINYEKGDKIGIISWDMIDPSYHAKGLGSKLLQYRLNRLQNNPAIESIIVRTSQLTYLFYEKNGFQTVRTEKDYWAQGFDLYLMKFQKE